MQNKFLLVKTFFVLILLITFSSSCDEQTTSNKKTDVDFSTTIGSRNQDSILAYDGMVSIVGFIYSNNIDTITTVNGYTIIQDTLGRKFFYIKYTNQFSQLKDFMLKFVDPNDSINNTPMGLASWSNFNTGKRYTCEGSCTCGFDVSNNSQQGNLEANCSCTSGPSGACNKVVVSIVGDRGRGQSEMTNINLGTFIYYNDYFKINL